MPLEGLWKECGRLVVELKTVIQEISMTDLGKENFKGFWNDNGCQVLELRLGISGFGGFGRGFGQDSGFRAVEDLEGILDLGFGIRAGCEKWTFRAFVDL